MKAFEDRLQVRFPRTIVGWKKLFWLILRRCPQHHKRLHYNIPWDGPHIMYGFCCDGVSYTYVGFWLALHMNWCSHQHMLTREAGGE